MATRNISPRADGEGNIGTSAKNWLSAFVKTINILGAAIMTQITTPSNPSAGTNKLYFKSDDKLYKLTTGGIESEVGAGTGDMLKSTYDTDNDGKVDVAEGINDGTYSATAVDIADAVTKKHAASGQFNQATSSEISGLTEKTSLADNDVFIIEDSAASYAKKKVLRSNVSSVLKTKATFTNASLSLGILTVTHSWALSTNYSIAVTIIDNNDKVIIPDNITCLTNSVQIDLSSYGTLSGTWKYLILG